MTTRGPVRETCRAKLNLFLDVVRRRADGYHELVTVFHGIDLADDLDVESLPGAAGEVRLDVALEGAAAGADVPAGEGNLVVRAARAVLDDAAAPDGVALRLRKRIPVGAGLGGGSADAAGALRGVNRLLALGRSGEDLECLGLHIGSDVPFLVRGGTALGRGRGEVLEPFAAAPGLRFLLIVPTFGTSTAAVYAALPRELPPPRDAMTVLAALATGDAEALSAACSNALLDSALAVEPRLALVLAFAREQLGPRVHLTGSGSTLFVPLRRNEVVPPLPPHPMVRAAIVCGA